MQSKQHTLLDRIKSRLFSYFIHINATRKFLTSQYLKSKLSQLNLKNFSLLMFYFHREFLDLSRNQKLLKQLVTRRGLPVLDNILTGLQKIKGIIAGDGPPCDLPQSVGSRLM